MYIFIFPKTIFDPGIAAVHAVTTKYPTVVHRPIIFRMLNGLTHEGIVLLDSGATGANYIQPTCFEILQHLDPSVNSKYHPAPSRVSLADETTTVKVYGYIHLDISIEDMMPA